MPARRRSGRSKSGGRKSSENEDTAYSPGNSISDMKGRPSGYGLRQRRFEDGVELMMECDEEDLLPAQIEAFKRDMEEFEAAKRKIKVAKDEQLRLQQEQAKHQQIQQHQQQQQQQMRQQQSVMAAQLKSVAPTSAPQPDVIIVGESPPKQLPTAQLAQPSRMVNPTPQQVYKFVNLPGQTNAAASNQWVIRPLMQVMPQQNATNQIQPRMNQAVSIQKSPYVAKQTVPQYQQIQPGNSLLGNKRPVQYNMAQQQQYVSPPKKKAKRPDDDVGALVPLDEYYYGKKEGDPTYIEDKGEHRFKCWYCSKMLYNNVKTMMHMQGHIDSEKQQNLDLSDLTQCKHCYKQFDTPFEMQTHIEKVHMNNANVLLCRICEKDHDSRHSLTHHMKQNHNACEMPYICQLCHFRSSMYSDVVDHFKKKHEHSDCVLCLYCLKIFHIKFVSQGWGQTQNYYHHLLRHQSKTNAKKCQLCKLTFFNAQEVKTHRKRDHMPNQKGVIGMNAKYTTPDQVMIRVPESGLQPKTLGVKSLNAPAVSKVSEHRGLRYPRAVHNLHCFECKMIMATNDHYKKYIQCSMCRFATSCSFAYANHMMGFHSGQITSLSLNIPWERPLPHPMYCLCGFGSKYGNKIANHLVFCTKRSCYKDKILLPPKEDKVDEEQDPRRKPGASLLDVLGLVKKPNIVSTEPVGDKSDSEDKRFESPSPRETTPSPEPSTSMESDVPAELTGAQKWLTVKLKDAKTPTKAAVFGTEETDSRPFTPEPEDRSRDEDDIDNLVNAALAESEDKDEESQDVKDVNEDKDMDTNDKENETNTEEEFGNTGVVSEECSVSQSSNDKEDVESSADKEDVESSALKDVDDNEDVDVDRAKDVDRDDNDSALFSASVEGMDSAIQESEESGCVDSKETEKLESVDQTGGKGMDEDNMDSADVSSEKTQFMESEKVSEMETYTESETSLDKVKDSYLSEEKTDSEMPGVEMQQMDNSETYEVESETLGAASETHKAESESIMAESETPVAESKTHIAESETPVAESETCVTESETREADSDKLPPDESEKPGAQQTVHTAEESETFCQKDSVSEETSEEPGVSEIPVAQRGETPSDKQKERETPRSSETLAEKPEEQETVVSDETSSEKVEERERVVSGDTSLEKHEERETVVSSETSSKKVEEKETPVSGETSSERPEEKETPVSAETLSGKPEERDTLVTGKTSTGKPEESEKLPYAPGKTDNVQSTHKAPGIGSSGSPSEKTKESSGSRVNVSTSSESLSSRDPHSSYDKYSQDRSRDYDRDRSHDRYRDRSDDRDRERSRDYDKDRSYDHDRSRDRAYDRDRDRREQHRSDRDRYGSHSGGYRDRYDDRRYQNDNRNYNRYQGGNRDYRGGYHGNQSHYQGGGYRDNYGNQRDRYGHNNRGQGYHGNRDYRGRGQGYRGNY